MRCKYVSETRCKNKATDKYHGIAVCADHKRVLGERVKKVLGSGNAAQQSVERKPCKIERIICCVNVVTN